MAQQVQENQSSRLIKAFFKFSRTRWHNAPASGLSQVETDILENIMRANRRGNSPRVSDIGMMLRVSTPTVTQHLYNLEDQGYVLKTHSKEDKRSVELSLTDKGAEALKSHIVKLEEDFSEFIGQIGPEAADDMIDLLMKAHEFFDKKSVYRDGEF